VQTQVGAGATGNEAPEAAAKVGPDPLEVPVHLAQVGLEENLPRQEEAGARGEEVPIAPEGQVPLQGSLEAHPQARRGQGEAEGHRPLGQAQTAQSQKGQKQETFAHNPTSTRILPPAFL
jgi:hypothetical protein